MQHPGATLTMIEASHPTVWEWWSMWLTVAIVVAWVVLAVTLGRRTLRGSVPTAESVERHRRACAALEAAVAGADGGRLRAGAAGLSTRHPTTPPEPITARSRPGVPKLRPLAALAVGVLLAATGVTVVRATMTGRAPADRDRPAATPSRRPAPAAAATTPLRGGNPGTPPARPTLPTAPPAPAVLDTGREIVVTVGRPTYRVTLSANAPCWIAVTEPAGHPDRAGRTLGPGARTDLEVVGLLVARLGNPAALEVRVDDRPVPLPVRTGVPRTVRFVGELR